MKQSSEFYRGSVKLRSYFQRLWTKLIKFWETVGDHLQLQTDSTVHIVFDSEDAVNFVVKLLSCTKTSKIGSFGASFCTGIQLWTMGYAFSNGSLPKMWRSFAEFHSVSSENSWRNKKEERYNRVKSKASADYDERPKNRTVANHWRWKSEASVDGRYYILIRPTPIRPFAVRDYFPRNDSVAPYVRRRRELAICNRFWCRPPHRYLSSLTSTSRYVTCVHTAGKRTQAVLALGYTKRP